MTNWLERAHTVFGKTPKPEPSIGREATRTIEKSPDPELPILPKSFHAVRGDGDSRRPESLHAERPTQPPLPPEDALHDWVPELAPPAGTAMPEGVRLIHWEPKPAPVAIDVCSVVVDVFKFIESELRALDSRLKNPWTIRGGFTVPQILDRLAQAGLEVELEPKGGVSTTECQDRVGGS